MKQISNGRLGIGTNIKNAVAKINKSQSLATTCFIPLNEKHKMAECMKIMF